MYEYTEGGKTLVRVAEERSITQEYETTANGGCTFGRFLKNSMSILQPASVDEHNTMLGHMRCVRILCITWGLCDNINFMKVWHYNGDLPTTGGRFYVQKRIEMRTITKIVTLRKSLPLRISMAAPPRWHQDAVLEVGTLILLA